MSWPCLGKMFPFKRNASQVLKVKFHHTCSLMKCLFSVNAMYWLLVPFLYVPSLYQICQVFRWKGRTGSMYARRSLANTCGRLMPLHLHINLKGIYLSKALTCMKIFLYKQELLFCQGGGYLWPHSCMNNLYISHRLLYAPTYSFWAIGSTLISLFRVTSWFDMVNNAVTRWMNLRENHLH